MATQRPVHIDSTTGNVRELVAGDKLGGVTGGTATGEALTFDQVGSVVQAYDADLAAIAGLSTGIVAITGAGTAAARTITGTASQVTVTNGNGVSGNPTLSLPQDIATTSTPQFAGLGIGVASSSVAAVNIKKDYTDPAASVQVMAVQSQLGTITANNAFTYSCITSDIRFNQAGFTQSGAIRGHNINASALGATGTISSVQGINIACGNLAAGTVTNAIGLNVAAAQNSGGGTLTLFTGINVAAQTLGSTNYAIACNTAAASNFWNLYITGTAANYIAGTLQLGHTGAALGKLESRTTSGAQLVASYDASNYYSTTVSSAGAVTFDAVGASAGFTFNDNLGVGASAFGTSAAKVLGIGNGTEPSTSPVDMVQIYSVDLSAGNATLGIRTETAVVTESVTSDRTLSVRINGTTYKICLKA